MIVELYFRQIYSAVPSPLTSCVGIISSTRYFSRDSGPPPSEGEEIKEAAARHFNLHAYICLYDGLSCMLFSRWWLLLTKQADEPQHMEHLL